MRNAVLDAFRQPKRHSNRLVSDILQHVRVETTAMDIFLIVAESTFENYFV